MRKRASVESGEPHGIPMRVYDLIAPPGTNHLAIPGLIRAALPALSLDPGPLGWVNGYIGVSPLSDGSMYVHIHLYNHTCTGASCPFEHSWVEHRIAPTLTPVEEATLANAVGEAPGKMLRGENPAATEAILRGLTKALSHTDRRPAGGFRENDLPFRAG